MADVGLKDLKDYHFWLDAQRRGRLKASIRLAMEALAGLGVRLFVRDAPDQRGQSVELLVIHPSERSRELGRKSALLTKIQSSGLQYAEAVFRKSDYRDAGVFCASQVFQAAFVVLFELVHQHLCQWQRLLLSPMLTWKRCQRKSSPKTIDPFLRNS